MNIEEDCEYERFEDCEYDSKIYWLPLEVWELITNRLNDKELFRLSVLNKYFYEFFDHAVFYTIRLRTHFSIKIDKKRDDEYLCGVCGRIHYRNWGFVGNKYEYVPLGTQINTECTTRNEYSQYRKTWYSFVKENRLMDSDENIDVSFCDYSKCFTIIYHRSNLHTYSERSNSIKTIVNLDIIPVDGVKEVQIFNRKKKDMRERRIIQEISRELRHQCEKQKRAREIDEAVNKSLIAYEGPMSRDERREYLSTKLNKMLDNMDINRDVPADGILLPRNIRTNSHFIYIPKTYVFNPRLDFKALYPSYVDERLHQSFLTKKRYMDHKLDENSKGIMGIRSDIPFRAFIVGDYEQTIKVIDAIEKKKKKNIIKNSVIAVKHNKTDKRSKKNFVKQKHSGGYNKHRKGLGRFKKRIR